MTNETSLHRANATNGTASCSRIALIFLGRWCPFVLRTLLLNLRLFSANEGSTEFVSNQSWHRTQLATICWRSKPLLPGQGSTGTIHRRETAFLNRFWRARAKANCAASPSSPRRRRWTARLYDAGRRTVPGVWKLPRFFIPRVRPPNFSGRCAPDKILVFISPGLVHPFSPTPGAAKKQVGA